MDFSEIELSERDERRRRGMAAARLAVAAAAVLAVAAVLPLLAAGAYADCYDFCFKDCISKDKSMRDYCSYACDKTCAPDAALHRRPVAVGGLAIACQTNCVRVSCHGVRAGTISTRSLI